MAAKINEEAERAAERLAAQTFADGLTSGTLMVLDLLLGDNDCKQMTDEVFDARAFPGEIGEDLREWLEFAHTEARGARARLFPDAVPEPETTEEDAQNDSGE